MTPWGIQAQVALKYREIDIYIQLIFIYIYIYININYDINIYIYIYIYDSYMMDMFSIIEP